MLKMLRKNTKAIIWTVVVSFTLWGGYSVGSSLQKQGRIAGEVFGKTVSFQEFNQFYRANQIFSFSGRSPKDPEVLKEQTWQSILYDREAKRKKIQVTDDEVRQEILRLLKAQNLENPTPQAYERWLQAVIREAASEFESQIRELLRIQKLLREINGAPVEVPSSEQAQSKFVRDSAVISAEVVKFKTAEEAKNFRTRAGTAKKWKKETAGFGDDKLLKTGLIPLGQLVDAWKVPEKNALGLLGLEKDSISEPVPMGGQTALFHVLDSKKADMEKFEKELKQKYLADLEDQKKAERFVRWSFNLKEQARLKDYLPRSEEPSAS